MIWQKEKHLTKNQKVLILTKVKNNSLKKSLIKKLVLQKVQQGLEKLRKDYTKIANIGDKTLKDEQYNDYYEYILTAKQEKTYL